MKQKLIITAIVVVSLFLLLKWYNRPANGIHAIGKDAVLIEGECITINWNASEATVQQALYKWQELKSR